MPPKQDLIVCKMFYGALSYLNANRVFSTFEEWSLGVFKFSDCWSVVQVIKVTKIECPTCGVSGFLQVRGTNVMVQHYQGFRDNKRVYSYHRVPYELFQNLQVSASKTMQVTTPDLTPISGIEWTGGDLNPRPPECKSGVHTNWTTGPQIVLSGKIQRYNI